MTEGPGNPAPGPSEVICSSLSRYVARRRNDAWIFFRRSSIFASFRRAPMNACTRESRIDRIAASRCVAFCDEEPVDLALMHQCTGRNRERLALAEFE